MTSTPKRALALAALAAILAAPAAAQSPRMMPGFDALDADGDGAITREDLDARRADRISRLDADGDGFVTQEEFVEFHLEATRTRIERRAAAMFERLDADGDGRLSAAELMIRPLPARMFDRMDADGDGAVTREEYDAARKAMTERRMHRHHRRGGHERPARTRN